MTPMHTFCPTGEDSWCRHNQALAAGETPPPHKPHITKPCAKGIEDIYKQLTKLELLNRCCHGKTQDPCKSEWMYMVIVSKNKVRIPEIRRLRLQLLSCGTTKGTMLFQMYSMNLETVIADKLRINQMKKKGTGEQRYWREKRALDVAKEIDVRKKREGLMYHSRGWIWVFLTMLLILVQTLVMKITPIGVGGGGGGYLC